MDDEQPHQELVKCVLVGDNAVGKTRLICARACRQKVSLAQLLNTHVPTVWAIDQYRIYKEVLENSMMVLDGVNVSLRLWDTFGDHHKDRRFAYGRSDVVLMCFDVGRQSSLDNCREMWYGQIRKFCPNTPILLVGCKNDVRFILKDEQYLNYCRERSPLVRQVREKDLVMPEQARAVAKELGLPYYETSVLSYFGVDEVFENAIRAALCVRRQQRFWMTNLKKVLTPTLQEPYCPPRPDLPKLDVSRSVYQEDRIKLFQQQQFTDVIMVCGAVGFSAHRFMLAAASPLLHRILLTDHYHSTEPTPTRSNSETSLSCSLGSTSFCGAPDPGYGCQDDTEYLLPPSSEQSTPSKSRGRPSPCCRLNRRRRSASFHSSLSMGQWSEKPAISSSSCPGNEDLEDPNLKVGLFKALNYPAIQSMRIQQCESLDSRGRVVSSLQTILTCTKLISPNAMAQVMRFVYTGEIEPLQAGPMNELRQAAEFLNVSDLYRHLNKLAAKKTADSEGQAKAENLSLFQRNLKELCLVQGHFADVLFRLEDGSLPAHKPILMARCDMMLAMFTHEDFVESSARVIQFPGVSYDTFAELLHYLYTDTCSTRVTPVNCVGVLELANRLCLPRLITLLETEVVHKMSQVIGQGGDVTEEALKIVEKCQLHNAEQLSFWCLSYLSQNYNHICRKYPKVLRALLPENQAWLNVHRWPPIWHLKDFDLYQRMLIEREREERPKNLKRTRNNSGCLCFSNQKSRKESYTKSSSSTTKNKSS